MACRALILRQLGRQLAAVRAGVGASGSRAGVRGGSRVPARLAHGPPGSEGGVPYYNLPFNVGSRYTVTLVFSLFFGTGFWAPSFILWYSMAKNTL